LSSLERCPDKIPFFRKDGFFNPRSVFLSPFLIAFCKAKVTGVVIQPIVFLCPDFGTITGPAVIGGIGNDARPDRVEFNIAAASEKIFVRADGAGFEATFPQGPRAVMPLVYISCLTTGESFHESRKIVYVISRLDDQMNVIRHEAIGIYPALVNVFPFLKRGEVIQEIAFGGENGLPVVAALYYMMRVIGYDNP